MIAVGVVIVFVVAGGILIYATTSHSGQNVTINLNVTGGTKMNPDNPTAHQNDKVTINVTSDTDGEVPRAGFARARVEAFQLSGGEPDADLAVEDADRRRYCAPFAHTPFRLGADRDALARREAVGDERRLECDDGPRLADVPLDLARVGEGPLQALVAGDATIERLRALERKEEPVHV